MAITGHWAGQRRVWGPGMDPSSTPEVNRSTADLRERGAEVESCLHFRTQPQATIVFMS